MFHCVLGLPNSSTPCDAKVWPHLQTDFLTCTTVLHCGHTFLNLQSQMSKFDGKNTIPYTMVKQTRKHTGNLLQCPVWQAVPPPTAKFFLTGVPKKVIAYDIM